MPLQQTLNWQERSTGMGTPIVSTPYTILKGIRTLLTQRLQNGQQVDVETMRRLIFRWNSKAREIYLKETLGCCPRSVCGLASNECYNLRKFISDSQSRVVSAVQRHERIHRGHKQYLVKWKGQYVHESTWIEDSQSRTFSNGLCWIAWVHDFSHGNQSLDFDDFRETISHIVETTVLLSVKYASNFVDWYSFSW